MEVLAVTGLLTAATLARLPNLLVIPAFTDEVEEAALGLAILRDGARPLTNVDAYIGPFWNYLLAGLFWLLGPSIAIPRAVVLIAGVLTVLLTYALGRAWFGRRVGLLGATLLAASASHTAVNSHVAWSNCVTPVFTTAGLLVLAHALRRDRPRWLPAAGVLFGLAFHTHPTAIPVLVGAALAVVVTHRRWLAGPWPYVAGVLAALMNVNLIVFNILTRGQTFRYAQQIQDSYVREVGESSSYLDRLTDLLVGLVRALGAGLDRQATLLDYASNPLLVLATVLLVAGLVLAVRQRAWLPLLVVVASVLILPMVNPKYDPILNVRYLAPILPICVLWMGLALEWLAWRHVGDLRRRFGAFGTLARAGSASGVVLAALLATVLVVGSLTALARYYDDVRENARTGTRILEISQLAKQRGPSAYPVVLDERLDRMALGPGAGIVLRVLHLTLTLEGVPTEVEWLGEERPKDVRVGQLLVLAARSKPQFTAEAVSALGLRDLNGKTARPHSQASRYGFYQFGPAIVSAERRGGAPTTGRDAEGHDDPAPTDQNAAEGAPRGAASTRR